MTQRQHLIGPIVEPDDRPPYFVACQGTAKTFRCDMVWSHDVEDLELSRTNARFQLGAELFTCEHELLKRAVVLFPNAKAKAALAEYETNMRLADALNQAGITPDTTCH
jgi:hypothetical protein